MKCRRFEKYLIPYAEGTLPGKLAEELEKHLAGCEACSRELDSLSCVVNALREADYPAIPPAHDLRARVMARISGERVRVPWWRSAKVQAYSAAAAGLLMFAALVLHPAMFETRQRARSYAPAPAQAVKSPERAGDEFGITVGKMPAEKPTTKALDVKNARPLAKDQWTRLDAPKPVPHAEGLALTPLQAGREAGKALRKADDSDRKEPRFKGEPSADLSPAREEAALKLDERLQGVEGKTAGHEKLSTAYSVTTRGGATAPEPARKPSMDALEVPAATAGPSSVAGVPQGQWQPNEYAPEGAARAVSQVPPGGKQQAQATPELFDYFENKAGLAASNVPADERARMYAGNAPIQPEEADAAGTEQRRVLLLERKLKEHPSSPTVLRELLAAYRSAGRAQDEYEIAQRLTRLDSDNPTYWFARAQAAERAKMPKTAAAAYRRAISFKLSGPNLELANSRLKVLEQDK